MTIRCWKCDGEYEYKVYGNCCPHCAAINEPFRSQGARLAMGVEVVSSRRNAPTRDRHERHKALLENQEDSGLGVRKSSLRRLRPYLLILAFLFGIVMLGTTLMGVAQQMSANAGVSQNPMSSTITDTHMVKKPIAEYASASFSGVFQPVQDVLLQVNYTGIVQPQDAWGLSERLGAGQVCLFIDVTARFGEASGWEPGRLPGRVFLRTDHETEIQVVDLAASGIDLSGFTPFAVENIVRTGSQGQLFFIIDEKVQKFALCWYDPEENIEQRMELYR